MAVLFDHGAWQPGAPYGIGRDSATGQVLRSLVGRGLVDSDWTGVAGADGTRYWLTMAGYVWLIRDAAGDLGMTRFGSGAADLVAQRISHLAQCARLTGVHG